MTTGTPQAPLSNPLAQALARWENEGGSAQLPADLDHTAILQHLGTAMLMRWNSLPRSVQSALFEAAANLEDPDINSETIRHNIAVFLHEQKNEFHRPR